MAFGDAELSEGTAFCWAPLGPRAVDPGPLYLVWARTSHRDPAAYPWPYQIAEIEVGELLWDALARAVAASDIAAARLVVVDAIDDSAARFYAHHGFTSVPGNAHRLVQKVSDIAAAVRSR